MDSTIVNMAVAFEQTMQALASAAAVDRGALIMADPALRRERWERFNQFDRTATWHGVSAAQRRLQRPDDARA